MGEGGRGGKQGVEPQMGRWWGPSLQREKSLGRGWGEMIRNLGLELVEFLMS